MFISDDQVDTTCNELQVMEDDVEETCCTHGEIIRAYTILVRKPEEKGSLVRLGRIWEDNV
jgi:hypothetical protein